MEPTTEQIAAMQAADRARTVLDDPLVKSALDEIEQTVIDTWVKCDITDRARAEDLKRLMWAAQQFRAIFEVTIAGGQVAKSELLNASTMQLRQEAAKRRIYGQ